MADIATIWSPSLGIGDWYVQVAVDGTLTDENGLAIVDDSGLSIRDGLFDGATDLQVGDDLFTAVLISLFTDAEAGDDDTIPDGTSDPRGWWGDVGEDRPIGSKLWLLSRSKQTVEVLAKAKLYIEDALRWLVDDGVAASVTVTTEWTQRGMLGAMIAIDRASGTNVSLRFDWAWKEQQ